MPQPFVTVSVNCWVVFTVRVAVVGLIVTLTLLEVKDTVCEVAVVVNCAVQVGLGVMTDEKLPELEAKFSMLNVLAGFGLKPFRNVKLSVPPNAIELVLLI